MFPNKLWGSSFPWGVPTQYLDSSQPTPTLFSQRWMCVYVKHATFTFDQMTGSLHATAVTQGWNRYQNGSQHRDPGDEPTTFPSQSQCSNHWAIPAPCCPRMCVTSVYCVTRVSQVSIVSHVWDKCLLCHMCVTSVCCVTCVWQVFVVSHVWDKCLLCHMCHKCLLCHMCGTSVCCVTCVGQVSVVSHVCHKCLFCHEPTFFCSSQPKGKPSWLSPRKLDWNEGKYLCCMTNHTASVWSLQTERRKYLCCMTNHTTSVWSQWMERRKYLHCMTSHTTSMWSLQM